MPKLGIGLDLHFFDRSHGLDPPNFGLEPGLDPSFLIGPPNFGLELGNR